MTSPALEHLQAALNKTLAHRPRRMDWGAPQGMTASLEAIWATWGWHRRVGAKPQRIARGLMAFRIQGAETHFVHLKYACRGIALPMDWGGRYLLEDHRQLNILLECIRGFRDDPQRFRMCHQGLQQALEFLEQHPDPKIGSAGVQGKVVVQQFLKDTQAWLPEDGAACAHSHHGSVLKTKK